MRIFDFAKKLFDGPTFDIFLSSDLIANIINIGYLNANVLFDV
jgi:hypothetical protein